MRTWIVYVLLALAGGSLPLPARAENGPSSRFGTTLLNTRWRMDSDGKVYDIDFLADGQLKSHAKGNNGKHAWKLEGSKITISMNAGFVIFTGEWTDAVTMGGSATNKKGKTWTWRATRVHY